MQILRQRINFYLIFSPNKCSERQTLNCRMATLLTIAQTEKSCKILGATDNAERE